MQQSPLDIISLTECIVHAFQEGGEAYSKVDIAKGIYYDGH